MKHSNSITAGAHRTGCHNRPEYVEGYPVQDGWTIKGDTRVPKMVMQPFRNSRNCQYTLDPMCGQRDLGCTGCARKQDLSTKGKA